MIIEIKNEQGIFYINGKRLGHNILSEEERQELNKFIKEYKENGKKDQGIRESSGKKIG